jgi:hypothetical protein
MCWSILVRKVNYSHLLQSPSGKSLGNVTPMNRKEEKQLRGLSSAVSAQLDGKFDFDNPALGCLIWGPGM